MKTIAAGFAQRSRVERDNQHTRDNDEEAASASSAEQSEPPKKRRRLMRHIINQHLVVRRAFLSRAAPLIAYEAILRNGDSSSPDYE